MKTSSAFAFAIAATAAALVAGCGGGSDSSSGSAGGGGSYGGGSSAPAATTPAPAAKSSAAAAETAAPAGTLALAADESDGLAFTPKALSAKAGTVTLKLTNGSDDALPHAIAIEGQGLSKAGSVVQPGGTSSVSAKLRPGTYTFYCPVGNHRAQGMEGTLTVR